LVKAVLGCALAAIVLLVVACALFTPQVVSSSQIAEESMAVATAAADGPKQRRAQQDAVEGAVDLYGNEVIDAIATYSLDPGGSLYEVHSPNTELPRLASPKS
jgi:hypothetical protein